MYLPTQRKVMKFPTVTAEHGQQRCNNFMFETVQ